MKSFLFLIACGIGFTSLSQIQQLKIASDQASDKINGSAKRAAFIDPLAYVNPFIGTGGHGHTFPGPVAPFGMIQVGPDTRFDGWDGCGGYHYSDSIIYGFSHTHLSGVGVPDYADLLIVPQTGKLNTVPGYRSKKGFGSTFDHKNEKATAGYYEVKLDNGIQVKLTANNRTAMHEYTFTGCKGKRFLILDLGYRDRVIKTYASAEGKTKVVGFRVSEAWARDQHFYFALETSVPFKKSKWIYDEKKKTYLMVLEFSSDVNQVLVKVGISGTDIEGAKNNATSEITHWDFEAERKAAVARWRKELAVIQASTSNQEVLTNFYTGLYHSYVHPSLWSDVDGRFRTFSNTIDRSEFPQYSVFSLWDTYRGANPLYTILQPKRVVEFVESFRLQYKSTGLLPVWTLSNNETNCMIGYHSVSVIADAYAKGLPINNPENLLETMIASSTYNHLGKKAYDEDGFISANLEAESVSKTLEYAYDDWCIANFAKQLGKTDIANRYYLRSSNWMNLMNPESGFFQARKGGVFLNNFKPNEVNHHYTEANAWQYSLAMPQHISQLVGIRGGRNFERFLDSLFLSSSEMSGRVQSDITGLIGQYAHGNEPSHHIAYLYNYCGAPHKTQHFTDIIMRDMYRNQPNGLSGNEDCGQMSAWYVLSAMGFYPVAPGSPTYAFGRPLFDRVLIEAGEKPLLIIANNNSKENKYIQSIKWNGEAYKKLFITHEMIQSGGMLEFEMGPKPEIKLSMYETDLKDQTPKEFVAVPYFTAKSEVFADSLIVSIDKLPFESGDLYYSFDNQTFHLFDPAKDKNIVLKASATLYAKVKRQQGVGLVESKTIKSVFTKFEQDKRIELKTPYANQYAGAGPQTLVDGQIGSNEYRGTEWQGFNGQDVEMLIELNQAKEINAVTVSSLKELRSWIFPPKGMEVSYSVDGVNFKSLGKVNFKLTDRDETAKRLELQLDVAPTTVKYLKIKVLNYGVCPDWHLGAGNPTWIFLDEIVIK